MWSSQGLPSPAVAQEVEDVWRGRRVLLSLSTPGSSQPGRASRTRARARQRWGIPSEHAQSAGLILERRNSSALPPSKPPEDETQKRHCLNCDGSRVRLSLCCCYFCCVRQAKLPEEATNESLQGCLIQYQLPVFSSVYIVQILNTLILSVQMLTEVI